MKNAEVNWHDGATVKNPDPLECPLARSPDCPLRTLSAMPVEQWWLWVYSFIRGLSELAPKEEYEHFLRDLERMISYRLSNGSWEPDQDF